jgi:hypothetical protein
MTKDIVYPIGKNSPIDMADVMKSISKRDLNVSSEIKIYEHYLRRIENCLRGTYIPIDCITLSYLAQEFMIKDPPSETLTFKPQPYFLSKLFQSLHNNSDEFNLVSEWDSTWYYTFDSDSELDNNIWYSSNLSYDWYTADTYSDPLFNDEAEIPKLYKILRSIRSSCEIFWNHVMPIYIDPDNDIFGLKNILIFIRKTLDHDDLDAWELLQKRALAKDLFLISVHQIKSILEINRPPDPNNMLLN